MDIIIFKDNSFFTNCWRTVHGIMCIISSYIYAYLGIYGIKHLDGTESLYLYDLDTTFFTVFTISMILNCLTEYYENAGDTTPQRDIAKIVSRYLKGSFFLDFLAWLPFHYFIDFSQDHHTLNPIFAIKTIRIIDGVKYMDIGLMMNSIRNMVKKVLAYKQSLKPI